MTLLGDAKHSNGYLISAPATRGRSFQRGRSSFQKRSHSSGGRSRPRTQKGKNFRFRSRTAGGNRKPRQRKGRSASPAFSANTGKYKFTPPEVVPDSSSTRVRRKFATNGRSRSPAATVTHAKYCMTLRQLSLKPSTRNQILSMRLRPQMIFRIITILGTEMMMKEAVRNLLMPLPALSQKVKVNPNAKARAKVKSRVKAVVRKGNRGVPASGSLRDHLAKSILLATAPRDVTVHTFIPPSNTRRLALLHKLNLMRLMLPRQRSRRLQKRQGIERRRARSDKLPPVGS